MGGSGFVGGLIAPYLLKRHELRILDLRPPDAGAIEYVEGSITDAEALHRALQGMEGFVNLVVKSPQGGSSTAQSIRQIRDNYEVNTVGLHLLLYIAQEMGVTRGVHTSTMSVHLRDRGRYRSEESVALDSPSVYGLTKGLGESICRYFSLWFDMNLIALRISAPRSRAQWLVEHRNPPILSGDIRLHPTDEEDLADAYLRAIDAVQIGRGWYDAVFISGDHEGDGHNLSKAKRLLGWSPRSHLLLDP